MSLALRFEAVGYVPLKLVSLSLCTLILAAIASIAFLPLPLSSSALPGVSVKPPAGFSCRAQFVPVILFQDSTTIPQPPCFSVNLVDLSSRGNTFTSREAGIQEVDCIE